MRIEFSVEGTLTVPDGSVFVADAANLIRLPSGAIISVHPIIEMESHEGADDHRDLTYEEACAIGVLLEDYDRVTRVLPH